MINKYNNLEQKIIDLLPCKVGDTMYYIKYMYQHFPNLVFHMSVEPILVTEISWKHTRTGKDLGFAIIANGTRYKFSSLGRTLFFTEKEAEIKINELKERANNGK